MNSDNISAPAVAFEKLFQKRVIVVSGKGGVGKTAISATIAYLQAMRGRKVLLAELNTSGHLSRLFNCENRDTIPVRVMENMWLVNTTPPAALKEYAMLILKFKALYNIVFENRMVKHFIKAVPALAEITMLGKLWYHAIQTQPYLGVDPLDVVVIDAPATGHFKTLITTPNTIARVTPPGPMRHSSELIDKWLRNRKFSGAVIVTIPEEMPVNEAIELERFIDDRGNIESLFCVVNRVSPFFSSRKALSELVDTTDGKLYENSSAEIKHLVDLARERLRLLNRQEEEIERLKRAVRIHIATIPLITQTNLRLKEVEYFTEHLTKICV